MSKKLKTFKKSLSALMVAVILFGTLGPISPNLMTKASSGTEVSGNITEDTTWILENSPYIVTDTVQVLEEVKLIIESGVEVKFNEDTGLNIGGELNTIGTESEMIIFTSNQENPNPGDWTGIEFTNDSADVQVDSQNNYLSGSIIKYCIVEYAEIGIYSRYSSQYVSNNIIRNNKTEGVYLHYTGSLLKNNNITDNQISGIRFINHDVSGNRDFIIIGNQITNNTNNGIYGKQNTNATISHNDIFGNNNGINIGGTYTTPNINFNNIYSNSSYNIIMSYENYEDVNAQNNWWGTTDTVEIESKIYDYYDDINLGKIIYEPFATAELDFDDQTIPSLSEKNPVPTLTNNNIPDYTFNSDEAGIITYGGLCSSVITTAIADNNTIIFNELADGVYSDCTITVTDAVGNASVPLNVSPFTIDTQIPVITLLGDNPVNLYVGDIYEDAGATALDNIDGDITENIETVNPVDINTIGTYTITYNVSDAAGNLADEIIRTVNVLEEPIPTYATVIELSDSKGSIELQSEYNNGNHTWPSPYPILKVGETITIEVNVDNTIADPVLYEFVGTGFPNIWQTDNNVTITIDEDIFNLETIHLRVFIKNSDNQYRAPDYDDMIQVFYKKEVPIPDTIAPKITLLGDNPVELYTGPTCVIDYQEAGATALDNVDGDITSSIVIGGDVISPSSEAGTYEITYNVSDSAGNPADEVIRTVIINEQIVIPPVRSNGSPTGALSAGTTETTLSLTTDKDATCRYSIVVDTEYSEMTGIFDTTGETNHSILITGLTNGNSYAYYIRCQDIFGVKNTDDYEISFSVASPSSGGGGGGGFALSSSVSSSNNSLKVLSTQKGTLTQNLNNENKVKVEIPKGSIKSTTTFTASEGSLEEGDIPKDKIGAFLFNGLVFNIEAIDASNNAVREFSEDLTITLTVPDLPDDTLGLELYYFDDESGEWIIITDIEFGDGVITFKVNHLTLFALFEIPEPIVKGVETVNLIDGDIMRNPNAQGMAQFDVYIVKIVGDKKYKRLILSPHVFKSYGHLKWENIKDVDQATIDSFIVSNLVRCWDLSVEVDDPKVYSLIPNGDTGIKQHLNITATEFETKGYDWNSIYIINTVDRNAYITGSDIN